MSRRDAEVLSIRIPQPIGARLNGLAKRSGRTKTAIVLTALEHQLDAAGLPARGSFVDEAGDLVGCVQGPKDLSTHKKHMSGFGRS